MLAYLAQPPPDVALSQEAGQSDSEFTSTFLTQTQNVQEVLQQAQAQHHALHWLIKICADIALGTSLLLPLSTCPSSFVEDVSSTSEVDRWVLLGCLMSDLDAFAHRLSFVDAEVIPDRKQKGTPKMVTNILLNLVAIADATGQAQK